MTPLHRMGNARRGVMVTSVLAMAAVLAGTGAASAAVPTVESTTERVLQAVSVTMGPDGSTTGVGSSVVRSAGSVEDADTSEDSFSPEDVVGDLPVRVLTSWRTADGAGTDLSDLQGYTGRVAIDLTIQNLTVKPEVLSYDTAGVSRQQAALVGSPLTVTASTGLGDLKAERVVTDDKDTGVNVTNGVIGADADGTTVQWAALLAPPILKSSSEFSLVVDAKDFDVPTFDLSVQPGLVTDPSMGALIDAAFNPASSEELELQRRTIELIGDVNVVLSRASDTISDVRTNLTSSAETLGTQTVADLQSSTQSVASNMSSLDGALQSLRGDLSSTLESTGSSAISEMDQAAQTVDRILGDTSGQPPTAQVDGSGCKTTVADPKQAGSVYGSLLQVASQLDGYSRATTQCKAILQQTIVDSIGPENPGPEACVVASSSVTCSLYGSQKTFTDLADDLNEATDYAIDLLRPELYAEVQTSLGALNATIGRIEPLIGQIGAGRIGLVNPISNAVYGNDDLPSTDPNNTNDGQLEVALHQIDVLRTQIDAFNAGISDVRTEISAIGDEVDRIAGEARGAVAELCEAVDDGRLDPSQLDSSEQEALSYLLLSTSCTSDSTLPGFDAELGAAADRTEQFAALDQMQNAGRAAGRELRKLDSQVQRTYNNLEAALLEGPGDQQLKDLVDELIGKDGQFDILQDNRDDLNRSISDLEEVVDESQVLEIQQLIDDAVAEAKAEILRSVGADTRAVYNAGAGANDQLGTMLERSASGLRSSSDAVVKDGRQSLEGQKKSFQQAQGQASNQISSSIEKGLGQVNSGVSSSTRDMEAASTLLIADLRKVLLDLGSREVGGAGLLGAMATNAATARNADYQLGLAGGKASSYASVRGRDVAGLMLRQAQTDASMASLAALPAFQLDLPSGSDHRTVYNFSIGDR